MDVHKKEDEEEVEWIRSRMVTIPAALPLADSDGKITVP
jgi:hypothetical protein